MNLQQRLVILKRLGEYILSDSPELKAAKVRAGEENGWFIPEFVDFQLEHIGKEFLSPGKLDSWADQYPIPDKAPSPKKVGIVMAGNVPLAGFHDFLCVFLSGRQQLIKPSSKDSALIAHLTETLQRWDSEVRNYVTLADMVKGSDAYIASGSNNSGRYFDYYFSKYPHIIRRNRTSVAILTGDETAAELEGLADDAHLYFGLGCRNITKLYVPAGYNFEPMLKSFKKYHYFEHHHKYKNNYDYQLAIMIINKVYYMTNGSALLQENPSLFSPISQLNYEFYTDHTAVAASLDGHTDIQRLCGKSFLPFGEAQHPALSDYADKTDTMQFLLTL